MIHLRLAALRGLLDLFILTEVEVGTLEFLSMGHLEAVRLRRIRVATQGSSHDKRSLTVIVAVQRSNHALNTFHFAPFCAASTGNIVSDFGCARLRETALTLKVVRQGVGSITLMALRVGVHASTHGWHEAGGVD